MHIPRLWALATAACSVCTAAAAASSSSFSTSGLPPRNYDKYDYHVLHLDSSSSPADLAHYFGFQYDGPLGPLDDHHIFRAPKHEGDVVEESIQELRRRRRRKRDVGGAPHVLDSILLNQKQKLGKKLVKRGVMLYPAARSAAESSAEAITERANVAKTLQIADPIFNEQWHIYNTGQPGHDLNVTGVWLQGITGKGATVCIIDDGLDMNSLDLQPNYFGEGSYDFNDQVDEPKPRLVDDQHGTRCAGEVAAAKNDVCGVGVAYDSKVSGVRILSKAISDVDEALSVVYEFQKNDIYSCSWGPPDDGRTMEAPGILIQRAMVKAVREGRQGNGTIYVFAAGNGAAADDNCNFDGYTNSIYSVTVGAIDQFNKHPYYSEKCSAQLVVTYSSGAPGDSIHTTDVGVNKCTKSHGGTSAAGPLAAGVYALMLSVRPDLSWRDIQWLTVLNAVPFFDEPSDWQDTFLKRKFSHQFGYGKLDTWAIVEASKTWKNVKPQAWFFSPWIHVKHEIPQGDQGLHSTFEVTQELLSKANLERLEHVTVTMNVEHTRRGDLSVELRSPSGLVSHLSTARKMDEAPTGYVDWTFMSVVHWGETGLGNWTVVVKDTIGNQHKGTFTDWKLKLWGEAIDAKAARPLPMPDEHDDDNHDQVATTTAYVSTGSVSVPTSTADLGDPASHPTRPAIAKPTDSNDPAAIATTTQPFEAPATASPTSSADTTATPDHEHLLPSIFPTFGVSKSTQIWIYGSLSIIIIFVAGLLTYLFVQRRKRSRLNPRDDYEFEMLDDQDEEAPLAGGRKKGNRRAGELYDAFAGESDEELFSDDEDDDGVGAYRDDEGSEGSTDEKAALRS